MRIGNSDIGLFSYKMKDTLKCMDYTNVEKDIGVAISNTFVSHILEKVNKANSGILVIRRTF